MNIVFPEHYHPSIQAAVASTGTKPIPAADLNQACSLLTSGTADLMIAGIDYSSRDVILACRDALGFGQNPTTNETYTTFSGLAVMRRDQQTYLLADMAACKHPTAAQLTEIICQTYHSAKRLLSEPPRIALLSFSTLGSGGHDPSIEFFHTVLEDFAHTDLLIDGEMQLDAAINPAIGRKKAPHSPVAGQANVLIAPDLNSGNLLYKAFEQIGGYTVAGPILQGFTHPVSDLSRGSTVADIAFTIEVMQHLVS